MASDGFTAQEMHVLKDQFNKTDKDKSGSIDQAELGILLKDLNEPFTQESLKAIIAEVDSDKSGQIDFNEFLVVVKRLRAGNDSSVFGKMYQKERSVEDTQKKTFTIWCNAYLQERQLEIKDLFNDLKDGIMLCALAEVLSGKAVKHNKAPKMEIVMKENLGAALKGLQVDGLKLVNIGAGDIYSGTPTTILGLIWSIICFYQLKGLDGGGVGAKAALLQWVHKQLEPYPEVELPQNFGTEFRNGKALVTLVHKLTGGNQYDQKQAITLPPLDQHDKAFNVAFDRLAVPKLLEPSDMVREKPDENSVMTYVGYLKSAYEKQRALKAIKPESYELEVMNPKDLIAGHPAKFTVKIVNRMEHKATHDNFTVRIEHPARTTGSVSLPAGGYPAAGLDASFNGTFMPLVVGVNRVRVLLNDEDISLSPATVVVSEHNKTCDRSCLLLTPVSPAVPFGGLPFTFRVLNVDMCGNAKKRASSLASQSLSAQVVGGSSSAPAAVGVLDPSGSFYDFSVVAPATAGKYNIELTMTYGNPQEIADFENERRTAVTYMNTSTAIATYPAAATASLLKPASASRGTNSVLVSSTPIDVTHGVNAGKSTCSGDGLAHGVAGVKSYFTIHTHNQDGAAINVGGFPLSSIGVACVGPSGKPASIAPPTITDNKNGTYSVAYVPEQSGPNHLTVTFDNAPLQGCPHTVQVTPGAIDPANTYADIPSTANLGDDTPFTIKCHDKWNNPCAFEPAIFSAHGTGPSGNGKIQVPLQTNGSASFKLSEVGDNKINVTANGVPIKNAPYVVKGVAGSADASTTTASGPGLAPTGICASVPQNFLVTLHDGYGNVITTTKDENVTFTVNTPSGKSAGGAVTRNANGTFDCTYTPVETGKNSISVELNGKPIKNSPFIVAIQTGDEDAKSSYSAGLAGVPAVAGVPSTFKVFLADSNKNVSTKGGLGGSLNFQIEGPSGKKISQTGAIKENPTDGSYEITYVPEEAGPNKAIVFFKGIEIGDSPCTVNVVPGAADASKTTASGEGLVKANVGAAAPFEITYRDSCGNVIPDGPGSVPVVVEVTNSNGTPISSAPMLSNNNRSVSYIPDAVGKTAVVVKVNGTPIKDMPAIVATTAGSANSGSTTAEGPGLISAAAGTETFFVVTLKDAKGNKLSDGNGAVISSAVRFPATGKSLAVSVQNNNDGTFLCKYTPEDSGAATVSVDLAGVAIKDSPFSISVAAGSADPNKTTASGEGLVNGIAGVPATFTVTLKDKDGNQPQTGGDAGALAVVCEGPSGKAAGTPFQVKDNNNGTYDVTYTPEEAGANKVLLKLNGQPVGNFPATVAVVAGQASALHCTASGPGLKEGIEQLPCQIFVTLRDAYDNEINANHPAAAGTNVVVRVIDGKNTTGLVTKNGKGADGKVEIEYTPVSAGNHLIHLAINNDNSPIKDSPFTAVIKSLAQIMKENNDMMVGIGSVREQRNAIIGAVDNDKSICACPAPNILNCDKCQNTFTAKAWLEKKFPGWQQRTGFP